MDGNDAWRQTFANTSSHQGQIDMFKTTRMILLTLVTLLAIGGLQQNQNAFSTPQKKTPAKSDKCKARKYVSIKNKQVTGVGCTVDEAKADAKKKLVWWNCKGKNDPNCQGECREKQTCLITGGNFSNESYGKPEPVRAVCKGKKGYKITYSANFTCECGCR